MNEVKDNSKGDILPQAMRLESLAKDGLTLRAWKWRATKARIE